MTKETLQAANALNAEIQQADDTLKLLKAATNVDMVVWLRNLEIGNQREDVRLTRRMRTVITDALGRMIDELEHELSEL